MDSNTKENREWSGFLHLWSSPKTERHAVLPREFTRLSELSHGDEAGATDAHASRERREINAATTADTPE